MLADNTWHASSMVGVPVEIPEQKANVSDELCESAESKASTAVSMSSSSTTAKGKRRGRPPKGQSLTEKK